MSRKQIVIYKAGSLQQAYLLKNMLQQREIQAFVRNESLQGAIGALPPSIMTSPGVAVWAEDANQASKVVSAFERQVANEHPQGEHIAPAGTNGWLGQDWPTCPDCRRRRQTICPICHEAGSGFPLADYNVESEPLRSTRGEQVHQPDEEPAEELPLLLICPNCDEAFEPRFYRLCQWCGHEFATGIELTAVTSELVSGRVIGVMMGLGALGVLLILYLWMLFRR